jgi:hypothetical protein
MEYKKDPGRVFGLNKNLLVELMRLLSNHLDLP